MRHLRESRCLPRVRIGPWNLPRRSDATAASLFAVAAPLRWAAAMAHGRAKLGPPLADRRLSKMRTRPLWLALHFITTGAALASRDYELRPSPLLYSS